SWDGKPVKKTNTNYLDKYRIDQFLMSLPEEDTKEIYESNMPRKYFVDIEVEVTDSFPEPDQAPNPVTSVSITNDLGQILVLGLKDLSPYQLEQIQKDIDNHFSKFPEKWTFKYIKMDSEYDLLFTLFSKLI